MHVKGILVIFLGLILAFLLTKKNLTAQYCSLTAIHRPPFLRFILIIKGLSFAFFCAESQNEKSLILKKYAKGFTRDQTRDLLVTRMEP